MLAACWVQEEDFQDTFPDRPKAAAQPLGQPHSNAAGSAPQGRCLCPAASAVALHGCSSACDKLGARRLDTHFTYDDMLGHLPPASHAELLPEPLHEEQPAATAQAEQEDAPQAPAAPAPRSPQTPVSVLEISVSDPVKKVGVCARMGGHVLTADCQTTPDHRRSRPSFQESAAGT